MDQSWSRDDKERNEIEQVLNDLVNSSGKQTELQKQSAELVLPPELFNEDYTFPMNRSMVPLPSQQRLIVI